MTTNTQPDDDSTELTTAAADASSLEQLLTGADGNYRTETGAPVRLVYESRRSGNEVTFDGHVVHTADNKPMMTVEQGDLTEDGTGRKVWYDRVSSTTGNERRVGKLVRIDLARPESAQNSAQDSDYDAAYVALCEARKALDCDDEAHEAVGEAIDAVYEAAGWNDTE